MRHIRQAVELTTVAALFAIGLGCNKDEGAVWVRFNGDQDNYDISVTADETLGDGVQHELTSTTGASVVGTVDITPSSGPVGTDHRILVALDAVYEERVQRVDVVSDSGSRGVLRFTMEQDSAELYKWVLDVTSMGVVGEERVDTLTFELFEVQEAALPGDTDIVAEVAGE